MNYHAANSKTLARIVVALPALLESGEARLRRQSRYARPLTKGGPRAAGIEDLLEQAAVCIATLARPEGVLMPVRAEATGDGICIAGRVMLDGVNLAHAVAHGGEVTAYLLTLGYDQRCAFDWLDGDYAAHHVQSDLSSEVLFALGRQVFQVQRERVSKTVRLQRIPVQSEPLCGQRRFWDVRKVQALLRVFDDANPGVNVTDTGCFQPLNSLLGLTIAVRTGADQGRVSASSNIRP